MATKFSGKKPAAKKKPTRGKSYKRSRKQIAAWQSYVNGGSPSGVPF